MLTALVEACIEREIDRDAWEAAQAVEEMERDTFASLAMIDWRPGVRYDLAAS